MTKPRWDRPEPPLSTRVRARAAALAAERERLVREASRAGAQGRRPLRHPAFDRLRARLAALPRYGRPLEQQERSETA